MRNSIESVWSDYVAELESINGLDTILRIKYSKIKHLLDRVCREQTDSESFQFSSLFSRIVFLSQKYEIPKALEWQLQDIRVRYKSLMRDDSYVITPDLYKTALTTIREFITYIFGEKAPSQLTDKEEHSSDIFESKEKASLRVLVIEIVSENNILKCETKDYPGVYVDVKYGVKAYNDRFDETIANLWIGAQLNLIDIKRDKEGYFIPRFFVLEPDYLVDVSTIAECFQNYGNSHLHYFRKKFDAVANSQHILLGNLANFFLDELIYSDNLDDNDFNAVFLKSFQQMPFEYTSCIEIGDKEGFRNFMAKAKAQFNNIKRVLAIDMPQSGFDRRTCILEPSFFCEKYGFQGRLDLLQPAESQDGTELIIELKSGRAPFPPDDPTRISLNHEVQTIIYRLIIQTVFNKDARHISPAILYSSVDICGQNLRWAAHYQQLEQEIIDVRNMIIVTEHELYSGDITSVEKVFSQVFDLNNYAKFLPSFFSKKLEVMSSVLAKSSALEIHYFYRFVSFVTNELFIQKVGDESSDSIKGVASLWNTEFLEREEALEVISGLTIDEIDDSGRDMKIRFLRTTLTGEYSNFREGEICILYPRDSSADTMLTSQILKGSIVDISHGHVLLRFRYKQRNRDFFTNHKYWVVEHDKLDNAYNSMFRGLYSFLQAENVKKSLLLGLKEPVSQPTKASFIEINDIESKKQQVIDKALAAEDYFLIVGPPGTGKTSVFARDLIKRFYEQPDINILVVAYTNRAVDELCAAICSSFGEGDDCECYIRIGTELSTAEVYRHRLLQNISQKATTRKQLFDEIDSTRIFVGTLSSISTRPELFNLKKFNIAIVDEASQILEPQIIGLLPLFDKFILIGDHKQLSTITLQSASKSKVSDEVLNSIELYDCRESLFERLFRLCQKNDWQHAYDTLIYHGRMHVDIASFVNTYFYDNQLRLIFERQTAPLVYIQDIELDFYGKLVVNQRVSFIHVANSNSSQPSDKVNEAEALVVVNLVSAVYELYKKNGFTFNSKTIGIIAPYRNQIALIKKLLSNLDNALFDDIMVDTVERFQGSQRDIIIVSFCMNMPYQLKAFQNLDREERVDRKLNVALTRAREQLFLVGNKEILQSNPIYNELLNWLGC